MNGYTAIEDALIARILAHFSEELDSSRVTAGDPDRVMDSIFANNELFGCVIEFGGGREDTTKPFSSPVWIWTFQGVFFIRYSAEIEANLRRIVDKLKRLLDADPRLAGTTPLAKFTAIGDAEPGAVDDVPFYWLPFTIEAFDK